MRNFVSLTMLVAALAGCVTAPPYGNFTQDMPVINTRIVDDTIRQMISLYPPASTQINLRQSIGDEFGITLVDGLRRKGYAVVEFVPPHMDGQFQAAPQTTTATDGVQLGYVLDYLAEEKLYRVTLSVGTGVMTRAYVVQNDAAVSAGAWLRKE